MRTIGLFNRRNLILLREMIITDFKLRYQGSVVGYLWSVLKPLLLFVVMYTVFVQFLKFGNAVPHFAIALLLGITLWNFFSEVTSGGMVAVVSRGDLLRKINFSKPVVVLSVVANAFINLLISLVVVVIFACINGVHFSWTLVFLIPLLLELVLFSTGVALLLSTLYVYFRDLFPIWEVVMQAGLYATPIIYPVTLILSINATAGKAALMNPMAQIIQDMRYVLTFSDNTNPTVWQVLHNPALIAIPYLLPLVFLAFGLWVFTRNSKRFAEIV